MISKNSSVITLKRSHFISGLAFIFFISTATNFGPYSSQYGPYYLLLLISIFPCLILLIGPTLALNQFRTISWWAGCILFGTFIIAAIFSPTGGKLKLFIPMSTGFAVYATAFFLFRGLKIYPWNFSSPIFFALLISAFVNLYEFLFAPDMFSTSPGRAAGFYINPNGSGMMLVGLWALWVVSRPNKSRILLLGISALALFGTIVTFSRSSIIMFILLSVIISLQGSQKHGRRMLMGVFGMAAAAGLILLTLLWLIDSNILSEGAATRASSLLGISLKDDSNYARYDAAFYYWNLFLTNPIFGFGAFESLADPVGLGPHNTFLAMGAEFGIFLASLYIFILFFGAASIWNHGLSFEFKMIRTVAAAWLILSSLFSHNILYSVSGNLMVGIILGLTGIKKNSVNTFGTSRFKSHESAGL